MKREGVESLLLEFDDSEEELEACFSLLRKNSSKEELFRIIRLVFTLCSSTTTDISPSQLIAAVQRTYKWAMFAVESFPTITRALDIYATVSKVSNTGSVVPKSFLELMETALGQKTKKGEA